MSAFLLLATAIAPPVVSLPPSPPVIMAVTRAPIGPPITVDVDVRSGQEILWSGPMRLSERSGASFSRQQSNASTAACTQREQNYSDAERTSLSVNLSAMRRSSSDTGINVRVNWERPGTGEGCGASLGSRTIAVSQIVWFDDGPEQIIRGDGGLTIRLRLR